MGQKTPVILKNIYGYISGTLTDDFVSLLYEKAEIVVFPSVYEGYGLPIIEALNSGKEIVLVNRTLNREIELIEQTYGGEEDLESHFQYLLSFLRMIVI